MEHYPIEGDVILTKDGLLWEVKGFTQPEGKVIAFVRYLPTNYINNTESDVRTRKSVGYGPIQGEGDKDSLKLAKIYPLQEKFKIVKEFFPEYLFNHERYYFPMQAFPEGRISFHFRPEGLVEYISQNEIKLNLSEPLKDAYHLCKWLSTQSNTPIKYFGITGSLLCGTWTEDSDIDLIVYGFGNSLQVREAMRNHFNRGTSDTESTMIDGGREFRKYSVQEFRNLYKERGKHQEISFYSFLAYEVRKLHQGIYNGRQFFIRFLDLERRESYRGSNKFSQQKIVKLGRVHITAEIRGDQTWWITPACVELANVGYLEDCQFATGYQKTLQKYNLSLRDLGHTFTLRGRYTENVRLLEQIEARGTLELIISSDDTATLQLALGSNSRDFLIPQ